MKRSVLFPVVFEKDEDGYWVVECPVFEGCYTQGKTLEEAIENLKEVILLCMEEKRGKISLPKEIGVQFLSLEVEV